MMTNLSIRTAVNLCLFYCFLTSASASTYVVDSLADGPLLNDSTCTLREAITILNQRFINSSLGCGAYDGAAIDTISVLPSVSGIIVLGSDLPTIILPQA